MKKHIQYSLVAAAVAAGLGLSGGAVAADTSFYGLIHLSADSINNGDDTESYLSSNASRLGFKGSKDLDGGLNAFFQLEGGIEWDGQQSTTYYGSTRDTFVGLQGGFGSVRGGRLPGHNQFVYDANLFGTQVGDPITMTSGSGSGSSRWNNALQYTVPKLGAVTLSATYAFDENPGVNAENWALSAAYNEGDLKLAVTHLNYGQDPASDKTMTAVTGSYKLGSVLLVGSVNSDTNVGDGTQDRTVTSLGAKMPAGPGSIKAQYTVADDLSGTSDTGGTLLSLGYDYALGKDTTFYVNYATADNDAKASFRVAGGGGGHGAGVGGTVVAGKDPSAVSLGIVYKF